MKKCFYLTTAIDYVNGQPHLGHAYEKVVSDVIARFRRSLGQEVFFLTGLDEHGQKVQLAALAEGKTPQDYCDLLAGDWQRFAGELDLSHQDFVRTSQLRHRAVVQAILTKLQNEGHFYRAEYRGFYSTRQETFLTEKDRLPDGTFDAIYGDVTELVEDNYYFNLRDHQKWLIEYIENNPDFIAPNYRRNEVLGFLKNNELENLCITRPISRLGWGIPLPFNPGYVTYVWFDALVNYISVPASYGDPSVMAALPGLKLDEPTTNQSLSLWPADLHIIGKDILKFHAVYWPIMLKAIGLPLPKQILVHGWWQKDGEKISKSTGNIIDPVAVIKEWGLDAFRYYVTRELGIGPDGNWTDAGFASRYTSELANGIGNLLNRSLVMLRSYRQKIIPARHDELASETERTVTKVRQQLLEPDLQGALLTISGLINHANKYIDQTAPFKLAKDPTQSQRLDEVLYNLMEVCRILGVLLWPFLPSTADKIFKQLGMVNAPDDFNLATWGGISQGHVTNDPAPLFPRRDTVPTKT